MPETSGPNESPTLPASGTGASAPQRVSGAGGVMGGSIGPYRILSHLGDGGFGSVYLAEQTQPVRRRVAVKVLRTGMDTPSIVARFEAERQVLVMMDHPGVAKVFDAGVTPEGRPYVAMEYVAGEPIARFCEHERLGVDERVRLMVKVCNAVHHAHMKGVIHRDLKPGNILVELVDTQPAPRVIDFGVAKALDRSLADSAVVTELGQMVGTPEYMPPEQARGTQVDVDTRADVYALGAVLYELLTGVTPLDPVRLRRAGYAELQRMIEEEVPVLPSERVTGVRTADTAVGGSAGGAHDRSRRIRRDLDWIVMKCLEKDRARRYDSAAALGRDLERYLRDEPVEAGPPSLSYRFSKFVRRNTVPVAAAAVCLLTGAAAFGATAWALRRALDDRARAIEHEAKAVEARDEAEAVTAFLTGMIESAQPENDGREMTVRRVLDRAARSLQEQVPGVPTPESPLLRSRLHVTLGSSYLALGELDEAERQLKTGVAIRERELGGDAPATLKARFNLAALYFARGQYDDAKALYQSTLEAWQRLRDVPEHEVLGAMNNLAQIAVHEGRLGDAETLQRRAIAGMEATLGAGHEHTLGAKVNLGSILRQMGRFPDAQGILTEAETGWRTAHGAEHPGTLLAMHNLVLYYLDAGQLEPAESMARRLLEVRTRVLGPDHVDTVGTRSNLGLVLGARGAPDAASVLSEAWESSRRALGDEHPTTLTTGLNLLSEYERRGWPAGSVEVVQRVLATLKGAASRPGASAHDLNACAWLLLTAEPATVQDPAAALDAAVRACDVERRAGGQELWQYLDTLAMAYARTGSPRSAVESQREAIERVPSTPEAQRYIPEMKERLAAYERAVGG